MWIQGETQEIDTRTADEIRFADLTIVGVLPRAWPKYSHGTFTIEQVVSMTRDETLPWEIDDRNLRWVWPRLRKILTGEKDDEPKPH